MRVGAVLLSIWSGLNLALSVHPPRPALIDSGPGIGSLRLLILFGGLAHLCMAACCVLALAVIWRGLVRGGPWAWAALCVTMSGVQSFAFADEAQLARPFLEINVVSALLLVVGLALTRRSEAQKVVSPGEWSDSSGLPN